MLLPIGLCNKEAKQTIIQQKTGTPARAKESLGNDDRVHLNKKDLKNLILTSVGEFSKVVCGLYHVFPIYW